MINNIGERADDSVMLVEDDPACIRLLEKILSAAGYKIRKVKSAEAALRSIETLKPMIIILDVMMAGMTGIELCNALRADERTASIPVIFCSALTNEEDRLKGFAVGCSDYINKPFNSLEVIARVGVHYNMRKTLLELERANRETNYYFDKLTESENRFKSLFQAESDAVFLVDAVTLDILEVNYAAEKLYGFEREELLKMKCTDLSAEPKETERAVYSETTMADVQLHKKKDGTVFPVELTGNYFCFQGRRTLISAVRDIGDRFRFGEELKKSNMRYNELVKTVPAGVFSYRTYPGGLGRIEYASPKLCDILSVSPGELSAQGVKCIFDLIHPEDRDGFFSCSDNAYAPQRYRWQGRFNVSGGVKWLRFESDPARDGESYIWHGVVSDITEQHEAELRLVESEERLAKIIENTEAGYFRIGIDGRFEHVNRAWLRMHGYDDISEIIGKHFSVTQVDKDANWMAEIVEFISDNGSIPSGECSRLNRDGTIGYQSFTVNAVRRDDHNVAIEGFLIDTTSRRLDDEAIKKLNERYDELVKKIPVGVFVFHNKCEKMIGFEFVSEKFCEIIGIDRDTALSDCEKVFSFCCHEDYPGLMEKINYSMKNAVPFYWKGRIMRNGTQRWVEVESNPFIKGEGDCYWNGIISDVTENVELQETIDQHNSVITSVIESQSSPMFSVDVDYRYTSFNRAHYEAMKAIHGIEIELGHTLFEYRCAEEDACLARTNINKALAGERVVARSEFDVEGHQRMHLEIVYNPVMDSSGKIIGVAVMSHDVTGRVAAEERARLDEMRLKSIEKLSLLSEIGFSAFLDMALEEVLTITRSKYGYIHNYDEETLLLVNLSWSRNTLEDCCIKDKGFICPLEKVGVMGDVIKKRRGMIINDFENEDGASRGGPSGHIKLERWMSVPAFMGGRIVAVVGVANKNEPYSDTDMEQLSMFMDSVWKLAELKRAEESIRNNNIELENRVRERTAQLTESFREIESFAYSVSHDLRTPLRAISGYAQIIQDECGIKLGGDGLRYLERITSNCKRMAKLIDAILSLAKINKKDMELAAVDLAVVAESVVREIASMDASRKVDFIKPDNLLAYADETLARTVFFNIIENSWKYTRDRERSLIELGTKCVGGREYIFIKDNGAGFDQVDSEAIFEMFKRLHSGNDYGGVGIGLATVRKIVARHGGRIWAESVKGKGTTIFFTFDDCSDGSMATKEER